MNSFQDDDGPQFIEFFFEVLNGAEYVDIQKNNRTHAYELSEIIWVSPNENVDLMPKQFAEDFKTGQIFSDKVRFIKD